MTSAPKEMQYGKIKSQKSNIYSTIVYIISRMKPLTSNYYKLYDQTKDENELLQVFMDISYQMQDCLEYIDIDSFIHLMEKDKDQFLCSGQINFQSLFTLVLFSIDYSYQIDFHYRYNKVCFAQLTRTLDNTKIDSNLFQLDFSREGTLATIIKTQYKFDTNTYHHPEFLFFNPSTNKLSLERKRKIFQEISKDLTEEIKFDYKTTYTLSFIVIRDSKNTNHFIFFYLNCQYKTGYWVQFDGDKIVTISDEQVYQNVVNNPVELLGFVRDLNQIDYLDFYKKPTKIKYQEILDDESPKSYDSFQTKKTTVLNRPTPTDTENYSCKSNSGNTGFYKSYASNQPTWNDSPSYGQTSSLHHDSIYDSSLRSDKSLRESNTKFIDSTKKEKSDSSANLDSRYSTLKSSDDNTSDSNSKSSKNDKSTYDSSSHGKLYSESGLSKQRNDGFGEYTSQEYYKFANNEPSVGSGSRKSALAKDFDDKSTKSSDSTQINPQNSNSLSSKSETASKSRNPSTGYALADRLNNTSNPNKISSSFGHSTQYLQSSLEKSSKKISSDPKPGPVIIKRYLMTYINKLLIADVSSADKSNQPIIEFLLKYEMVKSKNKSFLIYTVQFNPISIQNYDMTTLVTKLPQYINVQKRPSSSYRFVIIFDFQKYEDQPNDMTDYYYAFAIPYKPEDLRTIANKISKYLGVENLDQDICYYNGKSIKKVNDLKHFNDNEERPILVPLSRKIFEFIAKMIKETQKEMKIPDDIIDSD